MANHTPIALDPGFEERYPGASREATECAMSLVMTGDLMISSVARLLEPYGLTPASGLVLSMLADAAKPLSPHEIAKRLIVTRATVTGLLDSLERRKFIRRRNHPTDRRKLIVEITRAGREVAEKFRPIVHIQQREWLSGLENKEKRELLRLLRIVQDGLPEK